MGFDCQVPVSGGPAGSEGGDYRAPMRDLDQSSRGLTLVSDAMHSVIFKKKTGSVFSLGLGNGRRFAGRMRGRKRSKLVNENPFPCWSPIH